MLRVCQQQLYLKRMQLQNKNMLKLRRTTSRNGNELPCKEERAREEKKEAEEKKKEKK